MSRSLSENTLLHLTPELREILMHLPRSCGVYLLKDRSGTIIYIGKAKNLYLRVRSYFTRSGDDRAFVAQLEHRVNEIEVLVTYNEKEALLLENNLIKQHKPRFNVMLRDDKSYLVLRLDAKASFPRLEITRRIKDDGARYFGPFHSASDCRQTVRLVNRYFQLRTCSDRTLRSRTRPCLQYQIGRCLAPCVFSLDAEQYAQQVHDVTLFLRGQGDELCVALDERMQQAAAALEFERAARLRDQIAALRNSLQSQQVVSERLLDQDIFGYFRQGDQMEIVVLLVRTGKLVGRRPFSLSGQEFPDEDVLSSLVNRYYDRGESVPQQILLPLPCDDIVAKRQWLAELRGRPVQIIIPRRGEKQKLLALAMNNARSSFQAQRQKALDMEASLAKLQRRLGLTRVPRRIECFDISSIQGEMVVASMVVMVDGSVQPAAYRRFTIKSAQRDDFAAMYEVLSRRFRRARQRSAGWTMPDLIVVDGGKAQLAMALAAGRDVGLPEGEQVPDIIALAKRRPGEDGAQKGPPDRVFLPQQKDPIWLRSNTTELHYLAQLRDEAHRFALSYHRQVRRRTMLRSGLEDIPGIGPKRKKQLLYHLGSLKRIRAASLEELTTVPGMSLSAAEAVASYFQLRPATPISLPAPEGLAQDVDRTKPSGPVTTSHPEDTSQATAEVLPDLSEPPSLNEPPHTEQDPLGPVTK